VPCERVHLDEAALVEQVLDALTRGALAGRLPLLEDGGGAGVQRSLVAAA
jgi:hypothetical protein